MAMARAVSISLQSSPIPAGTKVIDLTGRRFGRLTVRGFFDFEGDKRALWLCDCECGQATIGRSHALRRGSKQSCGCLVSIVNAKLNFKHGKGHAKHKSPEYRTWGGMRDRCENDKNQGWLTYGGRGITVCPRWREGEDGKSGFECFLSDMGEKPTPQHSLDRIDVNGNYQPKNCRWATFREQARNRRACVFVEHEGRRLTLIEACEAAGASYSLVHQRMKRGHSFVVAIATPSKVLSW